MANQGPFPAGSVAAPTTAGATGNWVNWGGAIGAGSSPYATWNTSSDGALAPVLLFSGWDVYGFSIPAGSTLNGFVAQITNYASHSSGNTYIKDYQVYLMVNGSAAGTNKAGTSKWPTSSQTVTYGSSTDLWGTSPTISQVNDDLNFGVVFAPQATLSGSSITATVVSCTVAVYYTPPAGGNVPVPLLLPGSMGLGGCPFGIANPARRSRVEGVRFKQG